MNKLLAALAISLSTLALFFGDFEKYDDFINQHQISIYDLALTIKQREAHILVDLRSQPQRQEFNLPGSIDLRTANSLIATAASQKKNPALIIYGHEGSRAWQQWQTQGLKLQFVNFAVEQWLSKIMSPVIYRFSPQYELKVFEQHAEISRYFGGLPRYSDEPVQQLSAQEQMQKLKRRGCGF